MLRIFLFALFLYPFYIDYSFPQEEEENVKLGEFSITGTTTDIFGSQNAENYSKIIRPDEKVTWNVYIPNNYNPVKPAGVMLYFMSSKPNKIISSWKAGSDERNLIWISLANFDNYTNEQKMFLGVISLSLLQSEYQINTGRIYASGDSLGCVHASNAAQVYPNIISGAIYMNCRPQIYFELKLH